MKKILILSNDHAYTYNFRREIIAELLKKYEVILVFPYGEKADLLIKMGCRFIDLPLDKRGMNPITDLRLLKSYYKVINQEKPDAILSYTIKPNLYGGLISRFLKIPFFPNITGLGTALENESLTQKILLVMFKISFKNSTCVFFQNKDNRDFFLTRGFKFNKIMVLPGSGVNLEHFKLLDYPVNDKLEFMYIARIMKEKGIDEYLAAAEFLKKKYVNLHFNVLGSSEDEYLNILKSLDKKGIIKYHGLQTDVRKFYELSHCTIHPTSYPEGMSNVLLESAASGRPIITTNRSGCKETVDDGISGFIVQEKNTNELILKIETFINLDYDKKRQMGLLGRKKMETTFDRKIVVDSYMKQLAESIG